MEDIFAQASLCYLTNRCDEGFELINTFIITFNNEIYLSWEEQEVFCFIVMNVIEKRYKSWINLHGVLIQTDDLKEHQSIRSYLEIIVNELYFYSKRSLLLIEKCFFKSCLSSEVKTNYLKLQGDIHFFLSQISQSEKKLEHMLSSLSFYNQSLEICYHHSFNDMFLSIIYNKALLFILSTEEYDRAKDIIKNALNYVNNKTIHSNNQLNRIKSLLKYVEQI